jgi:hypothetical protein
VFLISVLKGFHMLEVVLYRFSPYINEPEKSPIDVGFRFMQDVMCPCLLFS